MGALELRVVTKAFGQVDVIKGVDLEVQDGEFCVFVGPSGCGKSTLLRIIAGLEDATSGDILLDGRRVQGEPERFEYWSMAKAKPKAGEDRKDLPFGYVDEPILDGRKRSGVPREEFLPHAEGFLRQAIADYINGSAPFTARLNPDIGGYNDYDQLMRLEEWQGRGDPRQGEEG